MRVYLDLVIGLNFAVDFLLLLGTDRLAGFPGDGKRSAWAALLGGAYSGLCLVPGFSFLGNSLWRLVSLCLMAGIAFGWNRSAVNRAGIFVLLSMALGGIAVGIGRNGIPALLLGAAAVWGLCRLGFGERAGREFVPVELVGAEKRMSLTALRDTGNALRDPITGEPVMVVSARTAESLWGLSRSQLLHPMQTMLERPGFRLIPYRAVGQPGSMLLGIRTEATVGKVRRQCVVAFATEEIGRGECYQALVC